MTNSSPAAQRPKFEEIPFNRWVSFLDEFTRENRGSHARLEIVGATSDVGDQFETEDRDFDGASADIKDRERTIWIAFGSTPDNHITHGVRNAKALRAIPRFGDSGAVLEIEDSDGNKSILQLSTTGEFALPTGSR
jgi:hypothetical protein